MQHVYFIRLYYLVHGFSPITNIMHGDVEIGASLNKRPIAMQGLHCSIVRTQNMRDGQFSSLAICRDRERSTWQGIQPNRPVTVMQCWRRYNRSSPCQLADGRTTVEYLKHLAVKTSVYLIVIQYTSARLTSQTGVATCIIRLSIYIFNFIHHFW